MAESKFKISNNIAFPSQADSFNDKKSPKYGLTVGNSISSEWFSRGGGGMCRFYTQQAEFQMRRMYANGKIDMRKYYPSLGTNGDVSLLNLPKKSFIPVPKIVDLVVNGMVNRNYSIVAKAIDPISQENKQAYRKSIEIDMNSKPIIEKAKENYGIDIGTMPIDELPETKDELNIHMQMEWKPSNCLSNQLAIATVMAENDFNLTIDRQIKRDLTVDGVSWVMNKFNSARGIVIERVDSMDMVYSETKDPYFRDCFYKGHVKRTLISDIFVEFPDVLKDEDVKQEIVNSGQNWYNYHSIKSSVQLKGTTQLLYFTYKTYREEFNKIKEKSNGEKVVSKADAYFDESQLKPGQTNDFTRVSKVEEVLFEGVMVLGTNILLKWELAKSMARPKSNKQKVCEIYNGVAPNSLDGEIFSLVSRMIPIADELNIIELKAAQIRQGITPDGIAIDLAAIASLDLGDGKANTHNSMLNMYLQKGSFFFNSLDLNGEYNNAQKPFQEIRTGDSINKLTALGNESVKLLTQLTDVVGLNKASDASTPDKDSLVGVQKMAAYNSNLSTKHILDGAGYVTLKTAEAISYRISDILKYYPSLREDLIQKIGATSVEDLDYVKDLHLSDFAIFLQLELDDEERAMLNADMTLAMEKGYISLTDKYKVMDVKILDLAIQYLTILIAKGDKKKQEEEAQKFKMQADENIRAATEAEKAKRQTLVIENDFKMKQFEKLAETESKKEIARGEQDRLTEQLKGQNSIELQYVINAGNVEKVDTVETNKNKRELEADTRESQKIKQRQTNGEPIDFEAQNAGMEIFNLNK